MSGFIWELEYFRIKFLSPGWSKSTCFKQSRWVFLVYFPILPSISGAQLSLIWINLLNFAERLRHPDFPKHKHENVVEQSLQRSCNHFEFPKQHLCFRKISEAKKSELLSNISKKNPFLSSWAVKFFITRKGYLSLESFSSDILYLNLYISFALGRQDDKFGFWTNLKKKWEINFFLGNFFFHWKNRKNFCLRKVLISYEIQVIKQKSIH